jgi:Fe(3+) dicitrate transport protein
VGGQQGGNYGVLIPGGGAEYRITDEASVLAGVHRGFVPTAPSAAADIKPESSINFEAGGRWRDEHLQVDLIGFFSDYKNLKGSCSLAAGCADIQDGVEFNGGSVHIFGLEAQVGGEIPIAKKSKMTMPIIVAYTLTHSAFQSSFKSDFPSWGDAVKSDSLPYLPQQQLSVSTSVRTPRWEAGAAAHYKGEARDIAGQGPIAAPEHVSALFTIDLVGHMKVNKYSEFYATCTNVLDEQVIISRRPYGARPNAPRLFQLGYKGRF